jgi:hypothetical protein
MLLDFYGHETLELSTCVAYCLGLSARVRRGWTIALYMQQFQVRVRHQVDRHREFCTKM